MRKTELFENYPQWTKARFNNFIKSALRQAWNKYPVKYEVLKKAYVGKEVNGKTGRLIKHYQCANCKKHFPQKEVQVDHKIDIGGVYTENGWDGVIERMFCSADNLQVLCKKCHKEKTYNQ
jgi:5-methylcytosine-specific restriction endonuclease McrA